MHSQSENHGAYFYLYVHVIRQQKQLAIRARLDTKSNIHCTPRAARHKVSETLKQVLQLKLHKTGPRNNANVDKEGRKKWTKRARTRQR